MEKVTREHLVVLELALECGAITSPDMQESVRKMIALASAAPDQEAVTVAIYSDASKPAEEWMRAKPFALIVGAGGVEPHLQRRMPGVQDVTIAYTHPSAEIDRLRALSVENIMTNVVPGEDGMGEEIYAKSVADVHAAFGKMVDREEELDQKLAEAQALLNSIASRGLSPLLTEDELEQIDAFLSATAQPAECQHRYMYFGTQPARRCADCNKVEPAEVKS